MNNNNPLGKLGYGASALPLQRDRNASYEKKFVDKISKLENYVEELQYAIEDRDELIDKLRGVIDYMIRDLTEKCGREKVNESFYRAKIAIERGDEDDESFSEEKIEMKRGGAGGKSGGGGGGAGGGIFSNNASPELFGKGFFGGGKKTTNKKNKKK